MTKTEYGKEEIWDWQSIDETIFYNTDVTLAGSTQAIILPLYRKPVVVNRLSMYFNSSNARSFNTRIHCRPKQAYYEVLDIQIGHTSDSRILQLEYKYVPHQISFNFSSYTIGDIVSIEAQIDEL